MKTFPISIMLLMLFYSVFGQAPNMFNYQAVIRNADGTLKVDQNVNIQIGLIQGSATGTSVYVETHAVQTNAMGLINLQVGSGTVVSGTIDSIDWSKGPYFLKLWVNGAEMGASQILSVPYALYAKKTGSGFSGNYNDLTNRPSLFSGNYADLTGKPDLFDGSWNSLVDKPIIFNGSYFDLTNKPVLWDSSWISIKNKPNFSAIAISGSYSDLLEKPTYAKVALTGNYKDLSDLPQLFDSTWINIKGKPTTLNGYGITDAVGINGDQYINGNKSFNGLITGSVNANNTAVINVATPQNPKDAANKAYVDILAKEISILANKVGFLAGDTNSYSISDTTGILSDIDGNTYGYIKIGTQIWMQNNLKTSHLNNGTSIPLILTGWDNLVTPAYCWYNNDSISFKNPYGALYNWYTVNTGMICPSGWHIPTDNDWQILTAFLGGSSIAGGKMKETGTVHWNSPNEGATNVSGFNGLPGGDRDSSNSFQDIRNYGIWWSATESSINTAYTRTLSYLYTPIYRYDYYTKKRGLSIRCIKN